MVVVFIRSDVGAHPLTQYESSVQNEDSVGAESQLNTLSSANRSTRRYEDMGTPEMSSSAATVFVSQLREHKRASAVTDAIAGVLMR